MFTDQTAPDVRNLLCSDWVKALSRFPPETAEISGLKEDEVHGVFLIGVGADAFLKWLQNSVYEKVLRF